MRYSRQETILIVEDEVRSQRLARLNLEPLGYRVVVAGTAREAVELAQTCEPTLIVLDLKLPDGSGFEVCEKIRKVSSVPIIILSAFGQVTDKLHGFALGADDYLSKPYDANELLARIEAVLRRVQGRTPKRQTLFVCGPLRIDLEQHLVTLHGSEVRLSRTEYRLLEYLALNAGRTLINDALLAQVWGAEYIGDHASLHLYVSRLRRKLGEDAHNACFVLTKPGIGYMMAPPDMDTAVYSEQGRNLQASKGSGT